MTKQEEMTKTKKCPRCGEIKNIIEFNKNKAQRDGLNVYCRPCQKISKEASRLKMLKERGW